jgi:transcription elongation factor Elf1
MLIEFDCTFCKQKNVSEPITTLPETLTHYYYECECAKCRKSLEIRVIKFEFQLN